MPEWSNSTKSLIHARSAFGFRSLVSMWCDRPPMSASISRSRAMHSATVSSPLLSGWRRRVSEKRLMQRVGLGVEKQHAHVDAARFQIGDVLRQLAERVAAARVDADGDARVAGALQEIDHRGQQPGRQIVDGVIGAVFERLQRHAFAGSRQAGDDDQLHAAIAVRRLRNRRSGVVVAHVLRLARDEFARAVDAAQLQHVVAHRGLDQHREVAPGGDRDGDLARCSRRGCPASRV